MSILNYSVPETAAFQLFDAGDKPMYATKTVEGEGGPKLVPDKTRPMRVHLYSPASKEFAQAQTNRNNRILARMAMGKGEVQLTVEEMVLEKATYLADCTYSWDNVDIDGKQGRDLSMAVYSSMAIGFVADQAAKHLGDWKNFSKGSQAA